MRGSMAKILGIGEAHVSWPLATELEPSFPSVGLLICSPNERLYTC